MNIIIAFLIGIFALMLIIAMILEKIMNILLDIRDDSLYRISSNLFPK
jgi:hypothetical protein